MGFSFIFTAFLLAAPPTGAPPAWDRFRGPNGSGVAETGRLPADIASPSAARWNVPIPPGHSSPVLSGRRLFLTAFTGEELLTLCLDARSGKTLWTRRLPRTRKEKLDSRNNPASPTPTLAANTVVAFFPDFGLVAYDFEGNLLWRTPLGPFQNVYGMGASPVIAAGRVILVCDQSFDSFIAAFDLKSGKPLWKTPRPEALSGHSTPIAFTPPHGELQILAPASFRMDVYSAATGEAVWWLPGLPSEMKSTPVLTEIAGKPRVFVSGFNTPENDPGRQVAVPPFEQVLPAADKNKDGKLSVDEVPDEKTKKYFPFIDLDSDGGMDALEWKKYQLTMAAENGLIALEPGGRGDISASAVLWKYHRGIPQLPSPLVYRGILYMVNDSGVLSTLDAAAGKLLKQARLPGGSARFFASPVASDSKIFFASQSGKLIVLAAGPDQQPLSTAQLDGEIFATPAVCGGRLFVRTTTMLYCFGM